MADSEPPKPSIEVDNIKTFLTSSPDIGWSWPGDQFPYELLTPGEIERRLAACSKPESSVLGASGTDEGIKVDSVEWQPNPTTKEPKEDRVVVRDIDWRGGKAALLCVFDGHIGPQLVDHAAEALPVAIISSLQAVDSSASNAVVSATLKKAVEDYDDALLRGVSDAFPVAELESMTAEEVAERIRIDGNDQKVMLASRGTTALICLVSADKRSLWTANVGDCQALLATRASVSDAWTTPMSAALHLTSAHNGSSPAEVARLQDEHPDELDVVVKAGRVLGQIAVTRALGDAMWKMPPVYVDKIFRHHTKSRIAAKVDALMAMYLTPPYLSGAPTVLYTPLPAVPADAGGPTVLLFLCSDGLKDLYDNRPFAPKMLEDEWVRLAGAGIDQGANAALHVVSDAIGGENVHRRSAWLTLQMPDGGKFADDTSVVVARW